MSGYNNYQNNDYQQGGDYRGDDRQGGYQQGYQQGGGYQQQQQQGGYQQGGYQQGGGGSANDYYNDASANQQYQQQQYGNDRQDSFGEGGGDGERGVMGALAGGAAGAFGGSKIGGKVTGHSKTSAFVGAIAGAFAGSKMQDAASDWKHDRDDRKEEEKKQHDEEKRRREDEKKQENERRDDSGSKPRSGHFAGSFTSSSRDIHLDNGGDYNLRASCRRGDGDYQSSTISLNKILENDGGSFRWSSGRSSGGGGSSGGSGGNYTVQQGDTLRGIASTHGTTFDEIARLNGISNPDLIYPGQTLQLPGGGGNNNNNNRNDSGGNFGSSARNVRLIDGGQTLEAELRRENGDWITSTINLDERITNDNGTLRLI